MEAINTIKKLEASKEFKEWRKEHKDNYLVHVFKLLDKANENEWQIGYYNKKNDRITTFVTNGKISINPESEIFKDAELIMPLELEKVSLSYEQIAKAAEEFQEQKYQKEKPLKVIMILQHIKTGHVWNITYVTQTYKTLNMKIDSSTGEVQSHNLASIFEFKA